MGSIVLFENSNFLLATLPCTSLLISVLMVVSWMLTFTNAGEAFSSLGITLQFCKISQSINMPCSWHELDWSMSPGNSSNGAELEVLRNLLCSAYETLPHPWVVDPQNSALYARQDLPHTQPTITWLKHLTLNSASDELMILEVHILLPHRNKQFWVTFLNKSITIMFLTLSFSWILSSSF